MGKAKNVDDAAADGKLAWLEHKFFPVKTVFLQELHQEIGVYLLPCRYLEGILFVQRLFYHQLCCGGGIRNQQTTAVLAQEPECFGALLYRAGMMGMRVERFERRFRQKQYTFTF